MKTKRGFGKEVFVMKKEISRRSFLKGTAAGALMFAAGSSLAGSAVAESADGIQWDGEYDVVVFGLWRSRRKRGRRGL